MKMRRMLNTMTMIAMIQRAEPPDFSHRVFSVRTDIPPAVVLCALSGSCADATTKSEVTAWQSKA